MNVNHLFSRLCKRIVGRKITFRRLAANSLLLYVDGTPGDKKGITICFEPAWHVLGPKGVLVGSRQAGEAAYKSKRALDRVGKPLSILATLPISSVKVEPKTFDIKVSFGRDYLVRTFVSDPTDDESWYFRENASGDRLIASPSGLRFKKRV